MQRLNLTLKPYSVYLILEGSTALIFSMIFTASSFYQVTVAGLTPLQLVLIGTILETAVFVFEVPTGVVADVYSRRLSVIIGYVLIGLGFLLEGSIPKFWTIAAAQVLWGLGYTFTSGATQAWITDEIGEEQANRALLRASQVGSLAALLGLLAGTLLANIRVNLPILLGGGMILAMAGFLALVMSEHGFHPAPREDRNSWQHMWHTFQGGLGMLKRRPALANILWIGLFYGLYSEGFDRLWVKHMLDSYTLPTWFGLTPISWNGIVRIGGMLFSVGAVELLRKRLDSNRHAGVVRALVVATLVVMSGLLVFALGGGSGAGFGIMPFGMMLLALWAVNVARRIIDPVYTAWVNQRLDSNVRATVISMSSQVDAIGQIAGGPGVGLIGSGISVRAAITTSGLLLAPVLLFLRKAESEGDRPPGDVPDAE